MRVLTAVGLVPACGVTMRSAADPVVSDAGRQSLSAFLEDAVARGEVPGVVAMVVGRDRILYEGAFGKRDVARNTGMTADTIFRIASMTKPLTTAAVLMLADDGRLKVDEPVSRYLPRFKTSQVLEGVDETHGALKTRPATAVMTIRHLLTHTSGIGYSWSDPGLAAAQRVTKAANDSELPLVNEPGTQWTYGASTRVLGDIVQAVTGQTIDAFLAARVTGPVGMVDTAFDVPAASHGRVVTLHQRTNGRFVEMPNPASLAVQARGDGGIYGTAADYARFIQLVLNHGQAGGTRLLSESAIAAMTTNQMGGLRVRSQPNADGARTNPFPIGVGLDTWGFGFQITSEVGARAGLRRPGTLAWAGLYNTHFFIDPASGIGVIVLMQVLPFYDEAAMRVYRGFEEAVYRSLH
jgi:CubicO group peptidase (beta-lactamase class C family)